MPTWLSVVIFTALGIAILWITWDTAYWEGYLSTLPPYKDQYLWSFFFGED